MERSAATRLERTHRALGCEGDAQAPDGAVRRRVQHALCVQCAADHDDPRGSQQHNACPAPSRVGSACCYWNGCGTRCSHPAHKGSPTIMIGWVTSSQTRVYSYSKQPCTVRLSAIISHRDCLRTHPQLAMSLLKLRGIPGKCRAHIASCGCCAERHLAASTGSRSQHFPFPPRA